MQGASYQDAVLQEPVHLRRKEEGMKKIITMPMLLLCLMVGAAACRGKEAPVENRENLQEAEGTMGQEKDNAGSSTEDNTGSSTEGNTGSSTEGSTGSGTEGSTGSSTESSTGNGAGNKTEKGGEEVPQKLINGINYDGIKVKANGAKVSVHDPSIKVFDGQYYIYGSHMTGAVSGNLKSFSYIGNGYKSTNALFENLFAKDLGIFDFSGDYGNGSYAVWAEDVIYVKEMQKYVMYFCTSSTYIKSNLCYAVADSPRGPFVWQGPLLYSGFTDATIGQTDVYEVVSEEYAKQHYLKTGGGYNNGDWPNCIDPAPFYDKDGRLWMTYGSWSGGIFLIELDPYTGKVIHPKEDAENQVDPYFGKRLMGGGHRSIEGPYILYDEQTDYYYLYVSYGSLERLGGYQIRVFRSKTVDGDYVDMNGAFPAKNAIHANYGLKLSGNYYLPSHLYAYMATGGQSAFIDTDGKRYLCFHSRFDNNSEYHEPVVKQIFYNEEGWPVMAPYTAQGETISASGYERASLAGDYYFINQGTKINAQIAQPSMITLHEDGTISGAITGTWETVAGTCYMKVVYQDKTYSGVFLKQTDEAGVPVMTFSAVGNNESIWGVKYLPVSGQ